jgi:hypothetical protein
MNGERGITIVELLIAAAVLLTVVAAVTTLLHDGLVGVPALEEAGDLHQRARVATDAIAADLRNSGAGDEMGPLADVLAAVLPRGLDDGPAEASSDVLTILAVPPGGATARLLTPLAPGSPTALIDAFAGCPVSTIACDFNVGTRAVVFDGTGSWDLLSVDAIGPGVLTISDLTGARAVSYAAGARITEATVTTYELDRATRQLRRLTGASMFTLADHVTDLGFEYFDSTLAALPLPALTDGPFLGSGATMFDEDLRRVRSVGVSLRFETGDERLRGADPRLFSRPGSAVVRRMVPDLVQTFHVTLRNGGAR